LKDATPQHFHEEFSFSSPVRSHVRSVRRTFSDPVAYFREIDQRNSLLGPLTFAVISTIGPLMVLICLILMLEVATDGIQGLAMFHMSGVFGVALGTLVALAGPVTIIFLLLLIFSSVSHLVVLLVLRRGNAGFRATFRANAYSSLGMLMSYVPIAGGLLWFYGFYLVVVGIREFHSTSTIRAVVVAFVSVPATLIMIGYGLRLLGGLLGA
jgi:hypothetical protein